MSGEVDTAPVEAKPSGRPFLAYWPEIDGLRSIPVLAVVLFHFDRTLLPGGFVAVDVFFTISGFLITAILLQDIETQRFSLLRYYQRRIARIAPAFFLVLAATLIAAWAIYSDRDFARAGGVTAAAAIGLANVKLMRGEGDYFAVSPDAQPLLHYWTLAVEEQFYLLFPFFLCAVTLRTRRPILISAIVAVASLALCVALTRYHAPYAFYLMPTRGWELLAGALVALLRWRGVVPSARSSPWFCVGGFALILGSLGLFRHTDDFPGWIALLPVLGAVAMLATAGEAVTLNRWLSHPLPVAIGKRSYALYLWHWPLFSFIDYRLFAEDFWTRTALKVGLLAVLTWLTYRLVERPARGLLGRPHYRWLAFGGFALAVGGMFAAGTLARDSVSTEARTMESIAGGGTTSGHGARSVVLIGDSHAGSLSGPLAKLARERGFTLHVLAFAATTQLAGAPGSTWPQVRAYLARSPADVVILAERWDGKLREGTGPLRSTLDELARLHTRRIILMHQPAYVDADRASIRAGARGPFFEPPLLAWRRAEGRRPLAESSAGAVVLDPVAPLRKSDGSIDLIGPGNRLTYSDRVHLSDEGVARVMPQLDRAIAEAAAPGR